MLGKGKMGLLCSLGCLYVLHLCHIFYNGIALYEVVGHLDTGVFKEGKMMRGRRE